MTNKINHPKVGKQCKTNAKHTVPKKRGRPAQLRPKICKLNNLSNPGKNFISTDDHDQVMIDLPIYCQKHPEDSKALEKLFQHTYSHLHSYLYQDKESLNYNRHYDLSQSDYMQECYIWFVKRLKKFDPKRCKDKKGWFGVLKYIRMDTERSLLDQFYKHTANMDSLGDMELNTIPDPSSDFSDLH